MRRSLMRSRRRSGSSSAAAPRSGRVAQHDVRVGAFATTRLPGVGVVVDRSQSAALGLIHGAALIIKIPAGGDPLVALSAAQQVCRRPRSRRCATRRRTGLTSGSGPSGPTVPGGVPIYGNGWTLPLPLGSFTISQLFHDPGTGGTHPGVDHGRAVRHPDLRRRGG